MATLRRASDGNPVPSASTADLDRSAVNDGLLAEHLERIAATLQGSDAARDVLETFIRTADDAKVVRINPVRFAAEHGLDKAEVIDLFLHARKTGLLTMEWQYVCPGCGDVVERLPTLTSATAHYYCQVCSADRDADLSDQIEVTFSVVPEVRRSRYHDPMSLDPEDHFLNYRFSGSAVVDDGSPLREHLRRTAAVCRYIAPGATETLAIDAEPGFIWFTNGPALTVGEERTSEERSFAFEYAGTRSPGFRADIAAGPIEVAFTNSTDTPYPLMVSNLPDHYDVSMRAFLSGAELLSNQTFLDLFESETIVAGEGLGVKRLALLFSDLQGSTALYERIGDLAAFDLVRRHFGELRDVIVAHHGALVKTIGDAVMASFVDPVDALRAALAIRARIVEFNERAGGDQLALKLGLHYGASLAVTLNDRLDYFGQSVNIAARVQGLAAADEIVLTEDVLAQPGAEALVGHLDRESFDAELRGVAGTVRVHRLRG